MAVTGPSAMLFTFPQIMNLFLGALQGAQNYSFVIGNKNFTIDWMAPAALPLFIGCEVFNAFGKGLIIALISL